MDYTYIVIAALIVLGAGLLFVVHLAERGTSPSDNVKRLADLPPPAYPTFAQKRLPDLPGVFTQDEIASLEAQRWHFQSLTDEDIDQAQRDAW